MREKPFENKIKKFLKEKNCWFIKYWGGGIYTQSGIPDLIICCNGYFVAIEVKGDGGKPSKLQEYNIEEIRKAGGIALTLYPEGFEDFKNLIRRLNDEI